MADMLMMSALQLGDPMAFLILVESDHGLGDGVGRIGGGARWHHKWVERRVETLAGGACGSERCMPGNGTIDWQVDGGRRKGGGRQFCIFFLSTTLIRPNENLNPAGVEMSPGSPWQERSSGRNAAPAETQHSQKGGWPSRGRREPGECGVEPPEIG